MSGVYTVAAKHGSYARLPSFILKLGRKKPHVKPTNAIQYFGSEENAVCTA